MQSQPQQNPSEYGYTGSSTNWYKKQKSAEIIVPILYEAVRPRTVLDVGCGIGLWSRKFLELGADVTAVDGAWIPETELVIPRDRFHSIDLMTAWVPDRRYDLAICLEVAEHLPDQASVELVTALVLAAPVICFSAAIPGQGGFAHINEQFQDHWIRRFLAHGYLTWDPVRPLIWENKNVRYYYAQNMLLFVDERHLPNIPGLHGAAPPRFISTPVHPTLYLEARDPRNYSLRQILKHLPFYLMRFARSKVSQEKSRQ